VIAAQKEAEANLIRRREETASVRSQGEHRQAAGRQPAVGAAQGAGSPPDYPCRRQDHLRLRPGDLAGQVKALVTQDA